MGLLLGSLGTIALLSLRGGADVGLLDGARDIGGRPLPDGPSYEWLTGLSTAGLPTAPADESPAPGRMPGPALSPTGGAPGTTDRTQYVEGRVSERLASGPWALTVDRVTKRRTEDRSALPPRPMVLVVVDLTLGEPRGQPDSVYVAQLQGGRCQGAGVLAQPCSAAGSVWHAFPHRNRRGGTEREAGGATGVPCGGGR